MSVLLRTTITEVGPEVGDLLDGGVLILFADGAPPELAEVSVLHKVEDGPVETGPGVGAIIVIGAVTAKVTAIGDIAWKKVRDIGHVVVNFNGAAAVERPGEICADAVDADALKRELTPGTSIEILN